jgi:hypothetical protein
MGNVFQQILSLDRALDVIDDDALVLKTRPDVVFLEIGAMQSVIVRATEMIEKHVRSQNIKGLFEKIWIPFFVPMIPFFAADQIFFGTARALRKFSFYDMFTEAYQILDQRYSQDPGGGQTAQEIRRFLAPFASQYPVLREYRFVWPKLALSTTMLPHVCHYNINSPFYREYLAVWLKTANEAFFIGDVPEANGKVGIIRDAAHRSATQLSLIEGDALPEDLGARLAIPGFGSPMPQVAFSGRWLQKLIDAPEKDPLGESMFREPLARAESYHNTDERRKLFSSYLKGLWALADSANVPFAQDA